MTHTTIECIQRKPIRWRVTVDNGQSHRSAFVTHNPNAARCQRWHVETADGVVKAFHSRRAAFGHFENGRKVLSKPEYTSGGKAGKKRIK